MGVLTKQEVSKLISSVESRIGSLYCWPTLENNWSGKDLRGAKYPRTYDCSGLVTSALYEATGGRIDKRASWNAKSLFDNCGLVTESDLLPGDLVFYGISPNLVSHVAIVVSVDRKKGVEIIDSCGGTPKTTTPEYAKKVGALVKRHKTYKYRPDIVGFGRLATLD